MNMTPITLPDQLAPVGAAGEDRNYRTLMEAGEQGHLAPVGAAREDRNFLCIPIQWGAAGEGAVPRPAAYSTQELRPALTERQAEVLSYIREHIISFGYSPSVSEIGEGVGLVLEPIFETDFYASSYGYRPGRRAQDAVAEVVHFFNPPSSYDWVIEADIEACFDRIHHGAVMAEVARRVGDRKVLGLVPMFLRAGVMTEAGELQQRPTGTPQGGIISPLLANIALSVLDREFERRWNEMSRYQGCRQYLRRRGLATYRLVRFADDFIVAVKGNREHAEAIMQELPAILTPVGLTLSAAKTRLTHIDDGFTFLGFRIQRRDRRGRVPCVYTFVSDEALASVKRKVKGTWIAGLWPDMASR